MTLTHTRFPPLCCCTIRGGRPGSTTAGRWYRSTNRTAPAGTRGRIARGLEQLRLAEAAPGPYLPQAVIAALHATAPTWQHTDWATICLAYDRLLSITESPVVRANRAMAIGFRDGFGAGLAALDEIADDPRLARTNTVATIRADLLRRAGRPQEAVRWYRVALGNANVSEPSAAFLRRRIAECVTS